MATTFKVCVRTMRKDGLYPVYIRITHNRNAGFVNTGKLVDKKGLNKNKEVKDSFVLNYCTSLILDFKERLNKKDFSNLDIKDVIEYLENGNCDICFSDYARKHIGSMINEGHERNAKNYKAALQSFELHLGSNKIMFESVTSVTLNSWMKTLESTRRAKEMYPICLRQIFKAALKEYNDYDTGNLRIKHNPWMKVDIASADRSDQKAISPEECRIFFSAPLPETKMLSSLPELGRDVAQLVLCLGGMNTVDLYNLQKSDVRNDIICYRRAKTKSHRSDDAYMEMRIEPFILPLVQKYMAKEDDPFFFDFHKRYSTSDSFCANANSGVKKFCTYLGIEKKDWYCIYTFRHTWGTVAQNDCGATLADVAFGMNHSHGYRVTRGYVKMDYTPAWELNAKVIDFIFFSDKKSKQGQAKDLEAPKDKLFRLSPKAMVYARAYYQGKVLGEVSDIGFGTIDAVIEALVPKIPSDMPDGATVQFRIKNVDKDTEAVYNRTKGKGF